MSKDKKANQNDKSNQNLSTNSKSLPKRPGAPRNSNPLPALAKSTQASPCLFVWNMADKALEDAKGILADVSRNNVLRACIEEGVATATAKTQYQRWFTLATAESLK